MERTFCVAANSEEHTRPRVLVSAPAETIWEKFAMARCHRQPEAGALPQN